MELVRLQFDLDILLRLSRNLERPGYTDPIVRTQLAAERDALINLLGPERLPFAWQTYRGGRLADVQAVMEDQAEPAWKRSAIEVLMESRRLADRLQALT